MIEMIRTGVEKKEKNAIKIARKRLGRHGRALAKRDQLVAIIAAQKKRQSWAFLSQINFDCWTMTRLQTSCCAVGGDES